MSEDQRSSSPFSSIIVVLVLVVGGWYFFQHYQISGLDKVSIQEKSGQEIKDEFEYVSRESDSITISDQPEAGAPPVPAAENPFTLTGKISDPADSQPAGPKPRNLRIAAWALEGFDGAKLAEETIRGNLVRVVRQFDLVALQQTTATQRDLLPRIVEAVNEGDPRYDYVMGEPTGPDQQSVRLAFVFDKARVHVDRWQTYTVADPENQMTFDPLVAWFRAVGPEQASAWTFSLVNMQVDLGRARQEVALLSNIMASVRFDGRGEDDVILAGLFQADDAYLMATMDGNDIQAAVSSKPTDILGQHQISNILLNSKATSEFVGRGGTLDFLRTFNLSLDEAKAVTSQLPVYAEFTAIEGDRY